MMGGQDFIHHTENLANMDRTELVGLWNQLMCLVDNQTPGQTEETKQNNLFSTLSQMANSMQSSQQFPAFKKKDEPEPNAEADAAKNAKWESNSFTRNLCLEHFPEPIILTCDKPLCKKCIPEYI